MINTTTVHAFPQRSNNSSCHVITATIVPNGMFLHSVKRYARCIKQAITVPGVSRRTYNKHYCIVVRCSHEVSGSWVNQQSVLRRVDAINTINNCFRRCSDDLPPRTK